MNIVLQVGVKALLRNPQGKYLLIKRSSENYRGMWDIAGGRINPGSSLLENLAREIKEETGLILVDKPRLIAAQDIMPNAEKHIVRLTYIADIQGEPKLDTQEHVAYQWLTLEEIKQMEDLDYYFKQVLEEMSE